MCQTIKATPKKRSLWQTPYVWLTLSWTTTNKCNIGREKKKGETYRIGSALRQGEVKTLQHSSYKMWWFRDSLRIRWRHAPQQIAVLFAVCTFGGFGEIAFTPRLKRALRFEKFHVMLTNWMFSQSVWCSAKTCVRCTIRHYADPFHATLHCLHVRCTFLHYAELFHVTLHRLCNVLQMSTKLFVIKLVYFTISCSNSTWATRLFIIWLNYSCLGCSVSWRKTKPSIIWQCHSFISYLLLRPRFYLQSCNNARKYPIIKFRISFSPAI